MKLATFIVPKSTFAGSDQRPRTGVVDGDALIDLTEEPLGLPGDMTSLLAMGPAAMDTAAGAASSDARRWVLNEVELLAPVPFPPKVLGIGFNYRGILAGAGVEPPTHQFWFNKQRTCVTGPGQAILVPAVSEQVDYEGELAIVIGRRAKSVPASHWLDYVAGFTVVNDVTVPDWAHHSATVMMGKSFDTHCPMGPWIVTPDELADVHSLSLRTWVNDELRQNSSTADLIFTPEEMIEYLTTVFSLEPGDVLATGTPAGVGAHFTPPRWLRPGDRVRIEIEGVGTLENPVAAAAGSASTPATSQAI